MTSSRKRPWAYAFLNDCEPAPVGYIERANENDNTNEHAGP